MSHEPRVKLPPSPFLYPILDSAFSSDLAADAEAAVRAGARILQLRGKDLRRADMCRVVQRVAPVCAQAGAVLVVNDCVDVACVSPADGVHLGQDDFPVVDARRLLGSTKIIGHSTHNHAQLSIANHLPVDYIAIGPVYETRTKAGAEAPLGVRFVEQARSESRFPLVFIGGIGSANVRDLLKAGADGVAMISEIYKKGPGRSVYDAVRRLLELFRA